MTKRQLVYFCDPEAAPKTAKLARSLEPGYAGEIPEEVFERLLDTMTRWASGLEHQLDVANERIRLLQEQLLRDQPEPDEILPIIRSLG